MQNYFRNLSAFRVLLLFLVLLSAAVCIFEYVRTSQRAAHNPEREEKAIQSLLQCAERFGQYLGAHENLAVSLATRFELIDQMPDWEQKTSQLLQAMLDASPDTVQGVGVSMRDDPGESRMLAFLSKTSPDRSGGIAFTADLAAADAIPSVREINMERRISWRLLSSPLVDGSSRFSSFLSVSISRGANARSGEAVVIGDMDWVRDLLVQLQEYSPGHALCVTPGRDFLWVDAGLVYFDKDLPGGHSSTNGFLASARSFIEAGESRGSEAFFKADIMGTGWALMLPRWDAASDASRDISVLLPLTCALVAVLALLLEGIFSAIVRKNGTSSSAQASPMEGTGRALGRRSALLEGLHSLLFKYRITNPEQARIDSELKVARDIQFSLVPEKFPPYSEWREFDLYSLLSPAREVGGDYYDFFMADPNRLVITVGDVSGKGVPAAIYMAVCRTAFRTLARSAKDPGQLLTSLNEMLVRDNQSGMYVTIVCYFVDLPTGKCEFAIAGHPAPLWNKAKEGRADFVDAPRETVIGMQTGIVFPVGKMRMQRGDTLLLYSDGVSEARNVTGDELEYNGLRKRFLDVVSAEHCQTLIADLEHSLRHYLGGGEQNDDITLVAFRYWGPGGQKMRRKTKGKTSVKMIFGDSNHAEDDDR